MERVAVVTMLAMLLLVVCPRSNAVRTTSPSGLHAVGSAPASTSRDAPWTRAWNGSYGVWFNETGLASGTSWSVYLNGAWRTTVSSTLELALASGAYEFSVGAVPGYSAHPGGGTVIVPGGPAEVAIEFVPGAPAYENLSITFLRTGLPLGVWWGVAIAGAEHTTPDETLVIPLAPGTYNYSVPGVPGYLGPVGVRNVTLAADNVTIGLRFVALFSVSFVALSLPYGLAWSVTMNGTTAGAVGAVALVTIAAGNYTWSVTPPSNYLCDPASGALAVTGTSTVSLRCAPAVVGADLFVVRFQPLGLPPGTWFSVTIGSTVAGAFAPAAATATLPNGTVPFVVDPVPGYLARSPLGQVSVAGSDAVVELQFTATNAPSPAPVPPSSGGAALVAVGVLGAAAGGISGGLAAYGISRTRPPGTRSDAGLPPHGGPRDPARR